MYFDHATVPSKGYFYGLYVNLMFGLFVPGYMLSGSGINQVLGVQGNWGEHDERNHVILQSAAILGMMIGAVTSKAILDYGRRRAILICNAVLVVMTIPNFFTNLWWFLAICRFFCSVAASVTINASSIYIAEAVPNEFQTFMGTVVNTGIVAGIFLMELSNLFLPYWEEDDAVPAEAYDTWWWRFSFSMQLISVLITTIGWLLFFKHEPMKFLISKAESAGEGSEAHSEALQAFALNH